MGELIRVDELAGSREDAERRLSMALELPECVGGDVTRRGDAHVARSFRVRGGPDWLPRGALTRLPARLIEDLKS